MDFMLWPRYSWTRPSGPASGLCSWLGHLWETPVYMVWVPSASGTEGTGLGGSGHCGNRPLQLNPQGKPVPGQQHLAPPRGVRQVGGGAPSPHPSEQAVPTLGTRVSRAERGRLPMPRRWRRPCSDPLSSGAGGPGSEAQQKAPTPPPSSKATLVSLSLVPGDQRGPLFHPTVCRGSAAAGPRAQDSVSRATACQTEVDGAQVSQAEALRVCDTVKVTAAPRTRQSGPEAGGRLLGGRVTEPGAGRLARTVKWASQTSFSKGSRILVKR